MSLLALPPSEQPTLVDRHVLGMAEMGYRGLSEQWLLRRTGDLHWRLIARSIGQREAVFTCAAGQPLYAAFCATSVQIKRPDRPRLGGELTLIADLYRVGHGRLASLHSIRTKSEEIGCVVLISKFVGRSEPGNNRSIVRRTPRVLALPPEAPRLVQRIAGRASDITRRALRAKLDLREIEDFQNIMPCPSTDFNAAGLLYFPSFSALADRALFEAGVKSPRMMTSRRVVYLGNVEPGEGITIGFRKVADDYDAVLLGAEGRPLGLMRVRFDQRLA